jgi:hypothetical protein
MGLCSPQYSLDLYMKKNYCYTSSVSFLNETTFFLLPEFVIYFFNSESSDTLHKRGELAKYSQIVSFAIHSFIYSIFYLLKSFFF